MKLEIRDPQVESEWTEPGEWFSKFIDLGVRLAKSANSASFDMSKLLITVPKREYVSAAIAFGYSVEKYNSGNFSLTEISVKDLESVNPGQMIRFLHTDDTITDIEFHSVQRKYQKDFEYFVVQGTIEGFPETVSLRIPPKIFLLPSGSYAGRYRSSFSGGLNRNLNRPTLLNEVLAKTAWPKNWASQVSPGLAIFGDIGYMQEQIAFQVKWPGFRSIFEVDELPLGLAARIDFLEEDAYAHFINVFEQFNKFPLPGTSNFSKVNSCEWFLLDGNNATSKLAGKEALIDARSISIIELGLPRSQGKALESFTAELNGFRSINAQQQLNWNPPAGVRIWGWTK